MLPEFNAAGDLPEGLHRADQKEVLARFAAGSPRRKWLGSRLLELLREAESTGMLQRVFIWGSFVTAKPSPRDLDILLIMADDFSVEQLPPESRVVFHHLSAGIAFEADVFWSRASIGEEALHLWLETYQMTRDLRRRGIIELVL